MYDILSKQMVSRSLFRWRILLDYSFGHTKRIYVTFLFPTDISNDNDGIKVRLFDFNKATSDISSYVSAAQR